MKLFLVFLIAAYVSSLTSGVRMEFFDDKSCSDSELPPAYYYGQCSKRFQGNYEKFVYDQTRDAIVHHRSCKTDACQDCVTEVFKNGYCYNYGSLGYVKFSYGEPIKSDLDYYQDNYLPNAPTCNETASLFARFVVPSTCENGLPGGSHRVLCDADGMKLRVFEKADCVGSFEVREAGNECAHFESADIYIQKSCQDF